MYHMVYITLKKFTLRLFVDVYVLLKLNNHETFEKGRRPERIKV